MFLEKRHEVEHAIPTFQKSMDLLDFNHKVDLEVGLNKMWNWAKNQAERNQFIWPAFEIDKKLRKEDGKKIALFNKANYLELAIYKSNPLTTGGASSLFGLSYRDIVTVKFN